MPSTDKLLHLQGVNLLKLLGFALLLLLPDGALMSSPVQEHLHIPHSLRSTAQL
jgi:hypothetical protein